MSERMDDFTNYYLVLGIPQTATVDEIKRRRRKLAKELHSDRHPEASKAERD